MTKSSGTNILNMDGELVYPKVSYLRVEKGDKLSLVDASFSCRFKTKFCINGSFGRKESTPKKKA